MKKIEDESKRVGGASVKTTERGRRFADMIAGLHGWTIGDTVERAIVFYAAHLAEAKDARGAALSAYIKAGGPTTAAADSATAKAGTLGKAAPEAKAAAARRDRARR